MSDHLSIRQQNEQIENSMNEQEYEKPLYLIIRKPQEGKTFICITDIKHSGENCLNIIVTMNTIDANSQFYERIKEKYPGENDVCTLNSRSVTKDVGACKKCIIDKNAKIIIMCAHSKRFNESIIHLLNELENDRRFKQKVTIHIDEAHKYAPQHRENIQKMNDCDITNKISMYSATAFPIWDETIPLFNSIYIVNIEETYGILKSDEYFGVKDCIIRNCYINRKFKKYHHHQATIPPRLINKYGTPKEKEKLRINGCLYWYDERYPFQLGNELEYINFIYDFMKYSKKAKIIKNDQFSYNFLPAYNRKLTHYEIMRNILHRFDKAIVFVSNGNGLWVFTRNGNLINAEEAPIHNEPSMRIENFIKDYPNRPVFITGLTCVSMSVTLINERIGNFDNVVMSHEQYMSTPENLYQLCRLCFNYKNWEQSNKLKKKRTIVFVPNPKTINLCKEYEKQVEHIEEKLSGSMRTIDEVHGNVPIKKRKKPRELKYDPLKKYSIVQKLKTFRKEEDDDELLVYNKVKREYHKFTGKEPTGKSLPKKNKEGYYTCSTTKNNCVQFGGADKLRNTLKGFKWDANYQLTRNKFKYARIYVVYDDPNDPTEYTWILRRMEIKNIPEVKEAWNNILSDN